MERLRGRRDGFTLVELLVVIAIITVLIAIALPVYSRAKERARQTACMANLHQIAMAARMYRMDMGTYPGPYDPATGEGGLNALYPAYIGNRRALVCPDDDLGSGDAYVNQSRGIWFDASVLPDHSVPYKDLLAAAGSLYTDVDPSGEYFIKLWRGVNPSNPAAPLNPSFFIEHYSSYNDLYNWCGYVGADGSFDLVGLGKQYLFKGDNLGFWYSWYCWDPDSNNRLGVWSNADTYNLVASQLQYWLAQQTYWQNYDPYNVDQGVRLQDGLGRPLWDPGNPDPNAYDSMPRGMPSSVFPGLINRNAPENTIVTRCVHHRPYTRSWAGKDASGNNTYWEKDIALRLDGSAVMVVGLSYDWAVQPQGR